MSQFFFELTPDRVLQAVESAGFQVTGRCQALNSFENRVYDVELDAEMFGGEKPVHPSAHRRVVKFYRPGRWSKEQILEEHQFIRDLGEAEVPAVAPLDFPGGGTLRWLAGAEAGAGIWYSVFPKVGGRAPDELTHEQLSWIGRLLGRVHAVGAGKDAPHRVRLTPETYGLRNLAFLRDGKWIPLEFESRYASAVEKICEAARPLFRDAVTHRLHGDCHLGNLLWNQESYFFIDFDDMVVGPPAQDLWLLIPGRDEESRAQLEAMLEGYVEMRPFDRSQLRLIEILRALRYVHYAAWIARRWEDPAFPAAFPQFGSHQYWSEQTDDLEEQVGLSRGSVWQSSGGGYS